jgi:hypothetical protein
MNAWYTSLSRVMCLPQSAWRLSLATLAVAGCLNTSYTPTQPTAFQVEMDSGCTLVVSVRGYAMHVSDSLLSRLVKTGMEGRFSGERKGTSSLGCPHDVTRYLVWNVAGRAGRPPRTFVGAQLFENNVQTSSVYSLIAGPDEPLIRSALIGAVSILTSRLLVNRDVHAADTSGVVPSMEPMRAANSANRD